MLTPRYLWEWEATNAYFWYMDPAAAGTQASGTPSKAKPPTVPAEAARNAYREALEAIRDLPAGCAVVQAKAIASAALSK